MSRDRPCCLPPSRASCSTGSGHDAPGHVQLRADRLALYASDYRYSQTKLRGRVEHYDFGEGSEAVEYFVLHGERDHEHVAEARERLEDTEDARLVGFAEAALTANWALLDGVPPRNNEARLRAGPRVLSFGSFGYAPLASVPLMAPPGYAIVWTFT
jgi:hypothetical protein